MDYGNHYIEVDFRDKDQLDQIKDLILSYTSKWNTFLVINDYVEDSDLDIWIQLPKEDLGIPRFYPKPGLINRKRNLMRYFGIPRYYPMSKRMNRSEMVKFLNAEQERQRMRL